MCYIQAKRKGPHTMTATLTINFSDGIVWDNTPVKTDAHVEAAEWLNYIEGAVRSVLIHDETGTIVGVVK